LIKRITEKNTNWLLTNCLSFEYFWSFHLYWKIVCLQ